MKHVRYQSIGNTVGLDEDIDDYWEIDAEGNVTRSICFQADGTQLKYDSWHDADSFGELPEGTISEEHLQDASYGKIILLSLEEFELKWRQNAKNRT